jgi:lysophospholipase L1-like esterase
LTERSDEKNSFYDKFKDEDFFFIDEIDEKNKVSDILIEPIYSGTDTTIWKEFLLPDRPYGTPDNSHPNENGHRKVFEILQQNIKQKLNK